MSLYSTNDAYQTYVYYLAIKRHFTSSYDFHKYNGKVNASVNSFETRKDKFFFYKLSKKTGAKDFILANIVENPNIWVGDILGEKGDAVFMEWKKRQQSISYVFKSELGSLDEDFDSNLITTDGQHPKLLRLYNNRSVSKETLIIVDDLTNVFSYWNKKLVDKIIFPDILNTCSKYKPFLEYDRSKMKSILVDTFATPA
jgi:hypothetical protein|tara:strand:+ start:1416 stop:2012 length:597 start_codon:yes stop_codon:yes gene_type:complete